MPDRWNLKLRDLIVPGLIALGGVLRFFGLNARPLDGDEGVILTIVSGDLTHLLATAATDVHPPLFHLMTSASTALFGKSAGALRLVSVLAGIGTVAMGPRLARRIGVNEWLVTAVLALSPFLVHLSQDARMYSLFGFLALASWLTTADLWDEAERTPDQLGTKSLDSARDTSGSFSFQRWVLWGLLGAGLVLTHHLGWLVLLAELVATVLWHRSLLRQFWAWLGGLAIVVVAYLPQLATTIQQLTGRLAEQSYQLGFGERIEHVIGAFYRMLAGRTFLDLGPDTLIPLLQEHRLAFLGFVVTLAVPAVLVLVGTIHLAVTRRGLARDWGTVALVPLLTAAAVGTVALHAPRYLAFLAPFLIVTATVGIAELYPSRWGKLLAVLMAGVVVAGLWAQLLRDARAPGVNAYAAAIRRAERPGDVVLVRGGFGGGEAEALWFEKVRFDRTCGLRPGCELPPAIPTPFAVEIEDMFGDYTVGNLAELRAVRPADRIAELLQTHDRVWFYDQTYAPDPLAGLPSEYQATVEELGLDKEHQPLRLYAITKNQKSTDQESSKD